MVHAYGSLNTYGADPETLKSKQIVFDKVLSGYSAEQINSAFERYFETGKGLPEPSDILNILKARQVYSRPEYKVSPPEETHPGYFDLSETEREKIDEALAQAKAGLFVEEEKQEDKPSYHYQRMPKAAQELVAKDWVERTKKLKGGG